MIKVQLIILTQVNIGFGKQWVLFLKIFLNRKKEGKEGGREGGTFFRVLTIS